MVANSRKTYTGLAYLGEKRKVVWWQKVAGPDIEEIQTYDWVYDEKDYKLRQLPFPPSIPL